jgi:hypothetical protein
MKFTVKRLPGLLAIALTVLPISVPSISRASDKCQTPNSTAQEIEACLQLLQKAEQKPDLKFPTGFASTEMNPVQVYKSDEQKWVDAIIQSDGVNLNIYKHSVCRGFSMCFIPKPTLLVSIPKSRIYSYTQGLQGSGNTANVALPGVAMTAFIMPVLAPFQAIASSRTTRNYEYVVTEISQDGEIKSYQFTASSLVPVHPVFEGLLPALTGMKSGETRPKDQILLVVEEAINTLNKKIAEDKSLLVRENKKKPWCEESLASEYPSIYARFQHNIKNSNVLRKMIDKPEIPASESTLGGRSLDEKWNQYLSANPTIAIWAKANPAQSAKMKKCPAS